MEDKMQKSLQCSVNNLAGYGKYQVCEPIKRGADGYVYRIQFRNRGKQQGALKAIPKCDLEFDMGGAAREEEMKKYKLNSQRIKKGKNEKQIHESLKSQYVVRVNQILEDDLCFYLIMDYFPKGDLAEYRKKKAMGVSEIKDLGLQIAKGIATIHNSNVIHRDIKPQNILLDENNRIKICDFGCASKFGKEKLKGTVGTLQYMAPEILKSYDEKVDIWSYGILLYFLATGKVPFKIEKQELKELALKVNSESIEKICFPPQLPYSFEDLIRKILVIDPEERMEMSEIIKHPFFKGEIMKPESPKSLRKQRVAQSHENLARKSVDILAKLTKTTNKENNPNTLNKKNFMQRSTNYVSTINESMESKKSLIEAKMDAKLKKNELPIEKMLLKKKLQDSRKSSRVILEPTDCKGLRYQQTIKKDEKMEQIVIDDRGYCKRYIESDKRLEISPEGKTIRVSVGNSTKEYKINNLSEKYEKPYNNYRELVKILKDYEKKKKQKEEKKIMKIKLSEQNWVEYRGKGKAEFSLQGKRFVVESMHDIGQVEGKYQAYIREYYSWLMLSPEISLN